MALPNPFQNTFNAPPWPSQVDPSKFGCIWTPRNDFFDGLCIAHRKKSPAARAKRQRRQKMLHLMILYSSGKSALKPAASRVRRRRDFENLGHENEQNFHQIWHLICKSNASCVAWKFWELQNACLMGTSSVKNVRLTTGASGQKTRVRVKRRFHQISFFLLFFFFLRPPGTSFFSFWGIKNGKLCHFRSKRGIKSVIFLAFWKKEGSPFFTSFFATFFFF